MKKYTRREQLFGELQAAQENLELAKRAGNQKDIIARSAVVAAIDRSIKNVSMQTREEAQKAAANQAERVRSRWGNFEHKVKTRWVDTIRQAAALANVGELVTEYRDLARECRAAGVSFNGAEICKLENFSEVIKLHLNGCYGAEQIAQGDAFTQAGVDAEMLR